MHRSSSRMIGLRTAGQSRWLIAARASIRRGQIRQYFDQDLPHQPVPEASIADKKQILAAMSRLKSVGRAQFVGMCVCANCDSASTE